MTSVMRGVSPQYSIYTMSPFNSFSYSVDSVNQIATINMTGFPTGTDDYLFQYSLLTQQESYYVDQQLFYMSCVAGICTFSFRCEFCPWQQINTQIYMVTSLITPNVTVNFGTTNCYPQDQIVYNMTINATAPWIVLTQASATTHALISWNTATPADVGTYSITVGGTINNGAQHLQTAITTFVLYVAAPCSVTSPVLSNITYRIASSDTYNLTQPLFGVTCQDYTNIWYGSDCSNQAGQACDFYNYYYNNYWPPQMIWQTTNYNDVGVFQVYLWGQLPDNTYYQSTTSFFITMLGTCSNVTIPVIDDQSYVPLSGVNSTMSFPAFQNISGCQAVQYSYKCLPSISTQNCDWITFNEATLTFDWSAADLTTCGTFFIEVDGAVPYSAVSSQSFTLTIQNVCPAFTTQTTTLPLCQIQSFLPTSSNFTLQYEIGLGSLSIQLPSYTQIPDCNYSIFKMNVTQKGVFLLPQNAYSINQTVLTFILGDFTFGGATVILTVNATLLDQNFDSNADLTYIINCQTPSLSELQSINTAPFFQSTPNSPPPIPCLQTQSSLLWVYNFPVAQDKEANPFIYQLQCSALESILTVVNLQGVLSLNLKSQTINQPAYGYYSCQVVLTDILGKNRSYQIELFNQCNQTSNSFQSSVGKFLPLTAQITKVTTGGEIMVNFNQELQVPDNFNKSRRLSAGFYDSIGQSLQITVLPGTKLQNPTNLNFSYNVTSLKNKSMTVQIYFQQPAYISQTQQNDVVKIVFNDTFNFVSASGSKLTPSYTQQSQIPKQSTPNQIKIDASSAVYASFGILIISFTLSFVLQAVLNQLLSAIRSLGIIVHMFVISLSYPVNCLNFFGQLFNLISFNLIPTGVLFQDVFSISQVLDTNLSNQFNWIGYGSMLTVNNMSTLFVVMIVWPVLIILLAFVNKAAPVWRLLPSKRSGSIQKTINHNLLDACWNTPVTYLNENYLVLTVSCFIQLYSLSLSQAAFWSAKFCSILGVAGTCFSFGFPLIILAFYFKKLKSSQVLPNLKNTAPTDLKEVYGTTDIEEIKRTIFTEDQFVQFAKRYGALLKGLNVGQLGKSTTIMFPVMSLIRRLMLAVIITSLYSKPLYCIIAFNFILLYYATYFAWCCPFISSVENTVQFINELAIVIVNYHLFLFTGYVDIQSQALVGNSVIIVVISTIGMNLSVILSVLSKQVIIGAKLKYAQRTQRKMNQVFQGKTQMKESHTTSHLTSGQNGGDLYFKSYSDSSNQPSRPLIVQATSKLKISHSGAETLYQSDPYNSDFQRSVQETKLNLASGDNQKATSNLAVQALENANYEELAVNQTFQIQLPASPTAQYDQNIVDNRLTATSIQLDNAQGVSRNFEPRVGQTTGIKLEKQVLHTTMQVVDNAEPPGQEQSNKYSGLIRRRPEII